MSGQNIFYIKMTSAQNKWEKLFDSNQENVLDFPSFTKIFNGSSILNVFI